MNCFDDIVCTTAYCNELCMCLISRNSFSVATVMYNCYIYKVIWELTIDEELQSEQEIGNSRDTFTIASQDLVVVSLLSAVENTIRWTSLSSAIATVTNLSTFIKLCTVWYLLPFISGTKHRWNCFTCSDWLEKFADNYQMCQCLFHQHLCYTYCMASLSFCKNVKFVLK